MRALILHNFWWKLLSLLLATLTWLVIGTAFQQAQTLSQTPMETTSTRHFTAIPITFLASPGNTNRYHINPATASVVVTGGAGRELELLQPRDIQVFVDVTSPGDEKLFRKPIQLQLPGELRGKVTPAQAEIERLPGGK